MRHTIARLYNSAILAVLPTVESLLAFAAHMISVLEVREAALEARIEATISNIAADAQSHRDALDSVNRHFDKVNKRNMTALNKDRSAVRAAVDARTAVENLINRG